MLRKLLFIVALLSGVAFAQSSAVTAQLTSQASSCTPALPGTACLILPIGPATNTVAATLGGTFSGTLQFEGSGDNSSTWVAVAATPSSGGASVTSATGTGTWQISAGGYTHLRIRCSIYSSGTVIATLNPSKAVAGSTGSNGASGTVNTSTAFAIPQYPSAGTTIGGVAAGTNQGYYSPVRTNTSQGTATAEADTQVGDCAAPTTITGSASTGTIAYTDVVGCTVVHDIAGSAAATITIPTPTTLNNAHPIFTYANRSASVDTLTPTTFTISESVNAAAASLKVLPGWSCKVQLDPVNASTWQATCLKATPLTAGSSVTLTPGSSFFVCTTTCTVTVPMPPVNNGIPNQFCVFNDDNVSTVITLAALGSSGRYENTARTAYGTAGTGTYVSGGAAADSVCIVGRDATHYLTTNHNGTGTVN